MYKTIHNLLLADDDKDDCNFFKEAIEDLPFTTSLITLNDGVHLMNFLSGNAGDLPDILFLDLNMPRKSGFECLSEIRNDARFKNLPVIIFSTSFDMDVVSLLYEKGANYYVRKPGEFFQLKNVIQDALTLILQNRQTQPARDNFVIQS